MREVSPEECKILQLNILINIAQFCEEHDIRYSLAYGTLIGAIRHKGFIPWDDDIDIIMMRDEYERFVATYKDDKYVLIHGENMSNHLHVVVSDMSTQLVFPDSLSNQFFYKGGVWVDCFPIDYVPDQDLSYRSFMKRIRFICKMQRLGEFRNPKSRLIFRLIYPLMRPFRHILGKLAKDTMLSYNKRKTSTVANTSLWYLNYPSFPVSFMSEYVDVEFEGRLFKAIKEYDSYLRGIYGDYMQLPPIEQRGNPRHVYIPYWRE